MLPNDAWLEKCGMLSNYAPWCGLEVYRSGGTMTNYFGVNVEKLRKYLYGRSRPYIYL